MGFASGLPCVPDMLKNRSRTKGGKSTRHDKKSSVGERRTARGCTSTPDECIGWLSFWLKWKKVGFSFGIVITLSIFVY